MKIFDFRYWSLLVVVPGTGFLLWVFMIPMAQPWLLSNIQFNFKEKIYLTYLYLASINDIGVFIPNFVAAVAIGLLIQAFFVCFWNLTSCSIGKIIGKKCARGKKTKSGYVCRKIREEGGKIKWQSYLQLLIRVKTLNCEELRFSQTENCLSTSKYEYSLLQLYLEKDKPTASYVEWEKFLSTLYEYLSFVMISSLAIYTIYAFHTLFFHHDQSPDLVLIGWILFLCFCSFLTINASKIHRGAFNQAEKIAYANFCRERGAMGTGVTWGRRIGEHERELFEATGYNAKNKGDRLPSDKSSLSPYRAPKCPGE